MVRKPSAGEIIATSANQIVTEFLAWYKYTHQTSLSSWRVKGGSWFETTFLIVQGQIFCYNPLGDNINIVLYQGIVFRRLNNLVQSNIIYISTTFPLTLHKLHRKSILNFEEVWRQLVGYLTCTVCGLPRLSHLSLTDLHYDSLLLECTLRLIFKKTYLYNFLDEV